MFLNICIKSKFKFIFMILTFGIIISVISIVLMVIKTDKIQNGINYKGKLDVNFDNYYAEYDMTVVSNKNVNTYNVKEWHKQDVITKLEYLDYMKNIVTVTLKDDTCTISNSGNAARVVTDAMLGSKNIASLSTFGNLFNSNCKECAMTRNKYVKDKEVTIKIESKDSTVCKCTKIMNELELSCLELILVNGEPKNYIIYNKNKKEYISIVYNVYEKNIEI